MSLLDTLKLDLSQLSDPNYLNEAVNRRSALLMPGLRDIFGSIDADLNMRGVYGQSTVGPAHIQAGRKFYTDVYQNVNQEFLDKYRSLLPVVANMESAEIQRKMANDAGFAKFISMIIGQGLGYLLPTGFKLPQTGETPYNPPQGSVYGFPSPGDTGP